MTTKPVYAPAGSVGIPNLDPFFAADAPSLPDAEAPDDLMLQNPDIIYVFQVLTDLVVGDRADVFIDTNSIIYYDPEDRNRRVQPDIYVAFGVNVDAIRERNGYVIWEVGKAPDFVLEVASESTADNDTGWKRELYARLGVGEYWRFDRTGGDLYGTALAGDSLHCGVFRPLVVNAGSDGVSWGYSRLLGLNLRWNQGAVQLQDPATGEILLDRRGVRLSLQEALQERDHRIRELEAQLEERAQPEP